MVSVRTFKGRAVLVFDVRVFKHFNWADSRDWVRVQHLHQQVHEDWVFVQAVAVVLLQRLLQVLQTRVLFLQNLLALSALDTEDTHAEQLLAGLRLGATLE